MHARTVSYVRMRVLYHTDMCVLQDGHRAVQYSTATVDSCLAPAHSQSPCKSVPVAYCVRTVYIPGIYSNVISDLLYRDGGAGPVVGRSLTTVQYSLSPAADRPGRVFYLLIHSLYACARV